MSAPGIAERVAAIRERMVAAARRAGRDPSGVRLLAVSKGHPAETVRAALAAGVTDFGENYLQELAGKAAAVPGARWHFQGALQRRKIKEILPITDSILSVSRAEELAEIAKRADRPVTCLIEVNVGGEESKGGARPGDVPDLLAAADGMANVRVTGLMTLPPPGESPEASRPWFRVLRELAVAHGLRELSMGMSDDFEIAIEEGSTQVRIGTALFGPRG